MEQLQVEDLTFRNIIQVIQTQIYSNKPKNYVYANSLYGSAALTMKLQNQIQIRKFLSTVWDFFENDENSEKSLTPVSLEENSLPFDVNVIITELQNVYGQFSNFDTKDVASVFGVVCSKVIGNHSRYDRELVKQIYTKFVKKSIIDLTYRKLETVHTEALQKGLSMNHRKSDSIYGVISSTIIGSNGLKDRRLVQKILNEVILPHKNDNTMSRKPSDQSEDIVLTQKTKRQMKRQKGVKMTNARPQSSRIKKPRTDTEIIVSHDCLNPNINAQNTCINQSQENQINDIPLQTYVEYLKSLHCYPEHPCRFCGRLQYKSSMHNQILTDSMISLLHRSFPEFDEEEFQINHTVRLCRRCKDNIVKGKLTPQAKWNKLNSPPLPEELMKLGPAEIQLISQVRPFMKIFHLSKGKGQAAIKGSVIHFPNSLDDVCKVLPLPQNASDVVIVHESTEDIANHKTIEVNPKNIYLALQWLKNNNPLYKNVQIVEQQHSTAPDFPTLSAPENPNLYQITYEHNLAVENVTYKDIGGNRKILRASFHQGSSNHFNSITRGNQCTAMALMSIAYACVQSPISWTMDTLNEILMNGDGYFFQKSPSGHQISPYEAQGTVPNIFGGTTILLRAEENIGSEYHGGLNKLLDYNPNLQGYDNQPLNKLPSSIETFIQSAYAYAIVTVAGYSMALLKRDSCFYIFDSHSRGPKGCVAGDGLACILKFPLENAATRVSRLIHSNVQPSSISAAPNEAELQNMLYAIIPIIQQDQVDQQAPLTAQITSGVSNQLNNNRDLEENISHTQTDRLSELVRTLTPTFGEHIVMDSLFHAVDHNLPQLENVIPPEENAVNLVRRKGKPLFPNRERKLEELCFIKQFPYGNGGIEEDRHIRITPLDYFQSRLLSTDTRFWDNSYLFYALARVEEDRVLQKIAVCGKMSAGPRNRNAPVNETEFPGLSNVHLYLSSIRGSGAYWKNYAGDLIAMIKQLGIPTLFITISSDDLNSSDSLAGLLIAQSFRHETETEELKTIRSLIANCDFSTLEDKLKKLSYETKNELLNDHPVEAARHFTHRIKLIMKFMKQNAVQLFGFPMAEYSYRVEFQNRGSGHVHMLVWLEGINFEFDTPEGRTFIEANISCCIPEDDEDLKNLVLKYQNHKHTKTCFKRDKSYCRFSFPQEVSEQLVILDEDEIHNNRGRFIKLKRNELEVMINNYHPKLLRLFKSNMDIQLVTGAMAIAYYIAKYMSKAEPTILRDEIQKIMKEVKTNTKTSHYIKAKKIALKIMSHREVGAPEAAFRLCHLPLRMSSRSFVFIPAYKPENRLHIIRKETIGETNARTGLNIIEKYSLRPERLQEICLYEFAAFYESLKRDIDEDEELDLSFVDVEKVKCDIITLKDGSISKGRMKRRTKPAVVKFPNFNCIEDKQNYYYCLLLLYLPFRNENFIEPYANELEAFQHLRGQLRTHEDCDIIRTDMALELDRALLRVANFAETDSLSNNEHDLETDLLEDEEDIQMFNADQIFQPINLVDDVINRYRTLSAEQKQIFDAVKAKIENPNSVPFLCYTSGAGGVGKSYLIDTLTTLIGNMEPKPNALLKAAPTGKAALNINATTLHRAFSLPVEKLGVGTYKPMGCEKIQAMRALYINLKWIIIDEISMVSYENLRMIHLRLGEIYNTYEPFAEMNVICFGDLMQLKPVRGHWIFDKPNSLDFEDHLWRLFQFHELFKNHRQQNGSVFINLLDNLREGCMTVADFKILESRRFDLNQIQDAALAQEFANALALYPTNNEVDEYNTLKTEELRSNNPNIYKITCQDTYADVKMLGIPCPKSLIPKGDQNTAGITDEIELGVGSRVMLRRNLALQDSLVNGSIGTVRGFIWTALREQQLEVGDLPEAVVVEFDSAMGGRKKQQDGFVRIHCLSVDFIGKKNTDICRRMIPLVLCWALNFHKAQGTTLCMASISLGNSVFAKGMAYVALSRVKTLNGLRLIELKEHKVRTLNINKSPCDEKALREMYRLRLTKNTGLNDEDLEQMLNWMLEYPVCEKCEQWECLCSCN